jgi:hypothetical protein
VNLVVTSPILQLNNRSKSKALVQATPPGVALGTTYYDFQTNAAMAERIGYYEDGSDKYCQVLWMANKDSTRVNRVPGFTNNRGSHYNFVDVSDPDNPTATISNWKKLESSSERSGWPSLIQFAEGFVATPSHNAVTNGTMVKFFANGGPGDDVFFKFSDVTVVADTALWPRAAVDGYGNVHLIYNRQIPEGTSYRNQVAYRRSIDGGITWQSEILFTGASASLPTGFPTTNTILTEDGAGGDTYAIDARGPNVVILYETAPGNVIYRRSSDFGQTWTDPNIGVGVFTNVGQLLTYIDSADYTNGQGEARIRMWTDTIVAPSGQLSVAIDGQGRAHLAAAQVLLYRTIEGPKVPDAGNPRYYTNRTVSDPSLYKDLGIFYFPDGDSLRYTMGYAGGGDWDGKGFIVSRRNAGASMYPQLGIDKNDNVYMVYTSFKSGDFLPMQVDTTLDYVGETVDTLVNVDGLYGHVFATHRGANSMTWSQPRDLTPTGVNCTFPTLCDDVTDRMYIAYSASAIPGDRVTSVETPTAIATIYLYPYPVSSLATSVDDPRELKADIHMYPNPAHESARLHVESVTPGKIAVSVVTLQGEQVFASVSPVDTGAFELAIPTRQLASGSYLLVIEQNGAATSRTLNVLH